jgi:hypothetical protein
MVFIDQILGAGVFFLLLSSPLLASTSITLRMDPRMLSRLKRLAAQRYLNYQSMMKQWLAERLEKEIPGS